MQQPLTRPRPAAPQVTFTGLNRADVGVAVNLVRAEITADAELRDLVVRVVEPREAFASCLVLLLALVHWVAETDEFEGATTGPCDGGARYALDTAAALGASGRPPEWALLCRQVAMSLLRDPHTDRVALSPISVHDLSRLCVLVGRDIETRYGYRLDDHLTNHMVALTRALASSEQTQ